MKKTRRGTKGEATRLRILESAIYCLGTYGERDTTFQKIADRCGVSQPLVVHYFKKHDNVFPAVLNYLLEISLKETVGALQPELTPTEKMKAYFEVSLAFLRKQPELGRVYVLFYSLSAYRDDYQAINTRLKSEAVQRLMEILREGIQTNEFQVANLPMTAKSIHNSLTGLILNCLTEKETFPDHDLLAELLRTTLLSIKSRG